MLRWVGLAVVALAGAAAGAVALNLIAVEPRPPAEPQEASTARAPEATEAPEVPEVAVAPERAAEPPLTDEQRALLAAADELAGLAMAEAEAPVSQWRRRFDPRSSFLYEDAQAGRWITLTAARVDCSEVDRVLAKQRSAAVGRADRCQRWLEKAQQAMDRRGISDQTPREFLAALGADMTVRVLLVYASWERESPDAAPERTGTEVVAVYPQQGFAERQFAARDAMYRLQKLGPYAEDRAVASID